MAALINCCLNISSPLPAPPPPPPPPSSSSSSSPLKVNQIPRSFCRQSKGKEESGSWRNQVVVGVACLIISFEMVPIVLNSSDTCAFAEEIQFINNGKGDEKWSEKRMCPPWKTNSLETIVPENLPRASAHRKFEAISTFSSSSSSSSTAPSISGRVTVKAVRSNCFSM